ncbi:hypothetical protein ACFQY0_07505 [Haloferula chungangensis]|uniref:Uncharacterized protein n=1 Tax=Haloferula chungangensis TaxID=1048331 RepID=A0ABW2L3V0_9BACT
MESDLQELEAQLQDMRPAALNDALLDRFTGAVAGTLQETEMACRPVEAATSKLQPAGLSDELTERLAGVVNQVPFPVDEKVVLFPGGSAVVEEKKAPRTKWWAAAAAVALAGGLSALMVSPPQEESKVVNHRAAPSKVTSGAFVPASFDRGVSGTDDLGVMWSDDRKPMRVVRVVYKDVVNFLNEKGEEVSVEVPRVEYLMVPERID